MATDNLQAGSAPANDLPHELGRQPHETSQQHADRLLEARRHGVDMAGDGVALTLIIRLIHRGDPM